MKKEKKADFVSLLQEYHEDVKDEIYNFLTSYVLDSIRHELWMYVDIEGNLSLRHNIGYASLGISNEQRCFIFSCGGDNTTAWDLLPEIRFLLNNEEIDDYLSEISFKTGVAIEQITVQDMQIYLQKTYPGLIEQWLDECFYNNPYGYLENVVQRIYEKIVFKIDGYAE